MAGKTLYILDDSHALLLPSRQSPRQKSRVYRLESLVTATHASYTLTINPLSWEQASSVARTSYEYLALIVHMHGEEKVVLGR